MIEKLKNILFNRNRSKEEALGGNVVGLLILKTMFDALSRLIIFSVWLYVTHDGHFSSTTTLAAFYTLVSTLLVFNFVFNNSKDWKSFSFWLGI